MFIIQINKSYIYMYNYYFIIFLILLDLLGFILLYNIELYNNFDILY